MSLLTEQHKAVVNALLQPVRSGEAFNRATLLGPLLRNRLSASATAPGDVDAFLARLLANANGARDLQRLRDAVAQAASADDVPTEANTVLETQLFASPTSFADKVVDRFAAGAPPIGPATAAVPAEYLDNARMVCSHLYYVLYQQLQAALQGTGSAFAASFPQQSFTSLDNVCTKLTAAVAAAVPVLPGKDAAADAYLARCHKAVYDPKVNAYLASPVNRELYAACFLPYHQLRFVTAHIATADARAAAPRDATVRRIAILCTYMHQLHLLFTVYQVSAQHAPASRHTYELRTLLDTCVSQVFDAEADAVGGAQSERAVLRMHADTQAAFEKSGGLARLTRDIEASRSAYNSVQSGLLEQQRRAARARAVLRAWTAALVVFLAALTAAMLLPSPGLRAGVFALGAALGVATAVAGLVAAVRAARAGA